MGYTREEEALLKWVTTFPINTKVESVADLADGRVLNQILEEFDPQYAVEDLEKNTAPTKWLSNRQSLESIYKALNRYVRDCCPAIDLSAAVTPDFNSIAEHDDAPETAKLLILFLLASRNGLNPSKYTEMTNQLDPKTKQIIEGMAEGLQGMFIKSSENATTTDPSTPLAYGGDQILELEESLASVTRELSNTKKRAADLQTRNDHLSFKNEELKEQLGRTVQEKEVLEKSNDGDHESRLESLKKRIQDDNNFIARQEQQIEDDRVLRENQERELRELRPAAEQLRLLQDEYQMLKVQSEEFQKKANTVDHYKRQVESLSDLRKTNTTLKERIETLENNQNDYDNVFRENQALETSSREATRRFQSLVEDRAVLESELKAFRETNRELTDRIELLQQQRLNDEEMIKNLHEDRQLNNSLPSPGSPPSPSAAKPLSLEEELERSSDSGSSHTLTLKISRLETEIALLKSSTGGATNANLRIDLEESDRVKKRYQETLQQLQEEHAIAMQQLNALMSKVTSEKDEALAATRKAYLETNQELTSTKVKLAQIQSELSSQNRELLAAKADLNALGQEELQALETLKATNETITTSLQNDLLDLQNKLKNVTTDYDQQKSHYFKVLLEKDQLRQDIASLQAGDPNTSGSKETQDSETSGQKSKQQIENQEKIIQDLQRRLKVAEEGGADANKETMIKNLARENALIASAWYDLSGRLQSNHVVLQRRQDAPKSWLNKQRQIVTAVPRR